MAEALELEARKPWKVVGCVWDLGWPASNLPGVSKSCHPWRHPDWTSQGLVVQKRLLLSSEASWHCTWPGSVNGQAGILSVNHESPCFFPSTTSYRECVETEALTAVHPWGIRRLPQIKEAFGTYFGIPFRPPGYSTSLWLGQPFPLVRWRGAWGRKWEREAWGIILSISQQNTTLPPRAYFPANPHPHRTVVLNWRQVWFPEDICQCPRHFRWSQLGVLLAPSRQRSGKLLNILQVATTAPLPPPPPPTHT